MKLSMIVPSIRPGNLQRLYDSIGESFHGEYEMIVVGPYELPLSLREKTNVTWIQDWGSPVRSQQRGLLACKGEYVSWAADDGYFLPNAIDAAMAKLVDKPRAVIIGKYYEGSMASFEMDNIAYYYIYTHTASRTKYIPKDCLMLMVGLVSLADLMEIGGFDCKFEALPMAFNDVSIRLYNKKMEFIFLHTPTMFRCGHMHSTQGDHKPIHQAQTYFDLPKFKITYNKLESINRINIPLDNWQNAPSKWTRRFSD